MTINARFPRNAGIFLVMAISIAWFSGCGDSPRPVPDGKDAVTFSRIVSLTPSITRSIYQLEEEDRLAGCSSYCVVEEKDSVIVAGSVVGPDIEKIVSLKPDLVILSEFISENDVKTLEKFGLRIEIFRSPESFDELCSQFIRLGQLIDKEKEAERIAADIKNEVLLLSDELEQRSPKPGVFMQIGSSPIFTVLPGTYMDDYIKFCGAENIAADLTNGIVGREFVVAKNPDYIFIVTMGVAGNHEKEQWSRFSRMNAARQNNIHILDSRIACEPTPENFINTLRLMADYMGKEPDEQPSSDQ
ncbi:MAG: ABC transporter substrate-binding protein [Bacteroidales bacterium]|jgi:iron complex transport system substrate-binding protein|nr:ABC transporter substrate-binding protein [Bacteroidales bacterium]